MKQALKICMPIIFFNFIISCTQKNELGTKENPIKFYLVPAQDMQGLAENGKKLQAYFKKDLNLEVAVELPLSYIAVVEAFGSKRADAAIINTFGYVLANEKYGVEARLKLMNRGRDEYYGQIIARVDGPQTIKQLNGKKFAYVDPASTSGYVLPLRLFKQEKINIKEHIFAGRHDAVVTAVYQKQVDAGATFYTPPDDDGTPKDARMLVKIQYPDVFDKIKILKLTGPIPNDPVAFRKDLPEEMKVKIADSLKKYIKTEDGAKVLLAMYHITDFKSASDKDYDKVREYLKDLNRKAVDFIK
ncbi:MAG: phosphate/phosphite/phosphonate ABC transporter substrate-binding protein [Bdellovibrionaceae bacterium]|nr:phosphate/phosphite/phosphonate ABC transporter substrate-binding protein [Bdellovibrio sp.]